MFIESELTWTIAISPCHMKSGLHIQRALLQKLLADFDKVKVSESHGYFICVTTVEEIGEGRLWEGKGYLAYKVRFRCLTFKPQKGEIGFAVVTGEFQEKGVMCSFGPIEQAFLSWKYLKDQFELVAGKDREPAHYLGKDGSVIKTGSVIRAEIVDYKYHSGSCEFTSVCKLKGIEKRAWEDKSIPQTQPGGGDWGAQLGAEGNECGWGTTSVANGKEAGGWGGDNDNGGGADWGVPLPQENGGWGASAGGNNPTNGAWGDSPAKLNDGFGDVPGQKGNGGGGWGSSPPKKSGTDGGWGGDTAVETTDVWDSAPKTGATASPGGWESSHAKKTKTGANDAAETEKKSFENDGWGDTAPGSGAWETVAAEDTGGGWGD
ncbi:hypothetical protein R1sor_011125 [Riccia sorocarpa]|uniref:RNA polymerase Rpb7-like N-terminal domain-containing protein n=1 Tax=Riccia sorocarpa TaxID=122646 RepID=A0ABD3I3G4_9MARC